MNIGVNARFLNSEILEGMGRYAFEILTRMVNDHPLDTFYFFFDRPYLDKYVLGSNVIPIVVSPAARHPLLFYYWFEHRLVKAVRKYPIDVFYSPDNFLSLSLDIPTALVIHDLAYKHYPNHIPWMARSYYRYFMPQYMANADHIITVSKFVRDDVIDASGINPGKVSVVYNALPTRKAVELNSGPTYDFPYFIYVGSINQRKNIKNSLKAFEQMKSDTNVKFIMVGKKYNLDHETNNIFDRLTSEGSLIHLQGIKDGQLMQLMRKAIGLVYVSLFEGFGIPLLEAMSVEIPVITSNVSSMPEVLGDAGLAVDPNDIEAIAQAMSSIYTKPSLATDLIEKGNIRLSHFKWEDSARLTYDVLLELKHKSEQ